MDALMENEWSAVESRIQSFSRLPLDTRSSSTPSDFNTVSSLYTYLVALFELSKQ
jgi:hypothetical protein